MEQQQDFFNEMEENKLPSMLNVLTILTFIGSGFGLLISIILPWFTKFMIEFMRGQLTASDKLKPSDIESIKKSISQFETMQSNLMITVIVGIVFCTLCIVAAVLMRKRKKDGYTMYLVARLAPLLVSIFILKTMPLNDVRALAMGLFLPVLMVILYTTQRKHLTN